MWPSRLTMKTEPQPTPTREPRSGTGSVTGCWLQCLVRRRLSVHHHHASLKLFDCIKCVAFVRLKLLLVCGSLGCLMLGNLGADPMPRASQQQSKSGQAKSSQTASGGITQNDAAKSGGSAAPCRNALESLKAFSANKYVRAVVLSINITCFLYFFGEIITGRKPPNDPSSPAAGEREGGA